MFADRERITAQVEVILGQKSASWKLDEPTSPAGTFFAQLIAICPLRHDGNTCRVGSC